jgi:ferric-dicitrate binding protein FerR (iron transport regulator)
MQVTRDVVVDLLTVCAAGEASRDTRALVEEWLRSDPELARRVEEAGRLELPEVKALPPTVEKQALDRTRRRLRWRSVLLGLAVYVSTLPLSVTFGSRGYEGLLIDDWPERIVVITLAIALWAVYWHLSRRMRVQGL